jgi:hypothetical protein
VQPVAETDERESEPELHLHALGTVFGVRAEIAVAIGRLLGRLHGLLIEPQVVQPVAVVVESGCGHVSRGVSRSSSTTGNWIRMTLYGSG